MTRASRWVVVRFDVDHGVVGPVEVVATFADRAALASAWASGRWSGGTPGALVDVVHAPLLDDGTCWRELDGRPTSLPYPG